tara:strand:- start:116 stop:220 length:105 start_codon:yes stop_codon:yes gene_type:complete
MARGIEEKYIAVLMFAPFSKVSVKLFYNQSEIKE